MSFNPCFNGIEAGCLTIKINYYDVNPCFSGIESRGIYKNYGGDYSVNPCFDGKNGMCIFLKYQ